MKIDTTQVAAILGIGRTAVYTLTKNGFLTPVDPDNPDLQRHFRKYDRAAVMTFKRTHTYDGRRWHRIAEFATPDLPGIDAHAATNPKKAKTKAAIDSPVSGISSRLVSIEMKVDALTAAVEKLVAIWS